MKGKGTASSSQNYHSKISEQLANLEIGVEFKLDLRAEDLEGVNELGHGNGGTVSKVKHVPTGAIMARKVRGKLYSERPAPNKLVARSELDTDSFLLVMR
jgi:hypothetical protein